MNGKQVKDQRAKNIGVGINKRKVDEMELSRKKTGERMRREEIRSARKSRK